MNRRIFSFKSLLCTLLLLQIFVKSYAAENNEITPKTDITYLFINKRQQEIIDTLYTNNHQSLATKLAKIDKKAVKKLINQLYLVQKPETEHTDQLAATTLLHELLLRGNKSEDTLNSIKLLIDYGYELNAIRTRRLYVKFEDGKPIATSSNSQNLIEAGKPVIFRQFDVTPPLCEAIYTGFVDAVELMTDHGANWNFATSRGCSPNELLDYALKDHKLKINQQKTVATAQELNTIAILRKSMKR